MNGYIKIVSCDDSSKWYAHMIGEVLKYDDVVSAADNKVEYRCRQPDGYINFVSGDDALDVTSQIVYDFQSPAPDGVATSCHDEVEEDDDRLTEYTFGSGLDRFDLEQQIMNCWNVVDDVDAVYKYVGDHKDFIGMDPAHSDKISNLLLGISSLYKLKFETLFSTFESLINEKKIK